MMELITILLLGTVFFWFTIQAIILAVDRRSSLVYISMSLLHIISGTIILYLNGNLPNDSIELIVFFSIYAIIVSVMHALEEIAQRVFSPGILAYVFFLIFGSIAIWLFSIFFL